MGEDGVRDKNSTVNTGSVGKKIPNFVIRIVDLSPLQAVVSNGK